MNNNDEDEDPLVSQNVNTNATQRRPTFCESLEVRLVVYNTAKLVVKLTIIGILVGLAIYYIVRGDYVDASELLFALLLYQAPPPFSTRG